jgi:hypothetical protein
LYGFLGLEGVPIVIHMIRKYSLPVESARRRARKPASHNALRALTARKRINGVATGDARITRWKAA